MATQVLPTVPPFVLSAGVAEILKRVELAAKSDAVNFNSATTVNLFEVPGNIIITELAVDITTAFDASGTSAAATATIEVPGSTGAIVAWDAGGTKLQTLTSDQMSPSSNSGYIKVPSSGGVVTFNQAPGTTTVGVAVVYLRYIPDDSRLQP